MTDAIGGFRQRIRRGGAGLFYFAGYAMQVAGRNYLVPIGSNIHSESATAFEAVDLGALVSAMETAGNRINIVNDGESDSEPDRVTITGRIFNEAPIARVGGSQSVEVGTVVQLDGSASSDPDGDELTFEWIAPTGVALDDSTIAQPQFTATEEDVYTFTLTVDDGVFRSAPVVVITVTEPGPGPAAPSADAGLDQVVAAGTTVLLDGRGSVDPDGDEIIYFWEQTTGREVELMAEEDGTATFVAPDSGRYEFSLVVSDGRTSSSPDEVRIIAVLQNARPIADTGPDQTVALGDTVQLDGSGSEDPFLGEIVSYRWEAPEGITLQQADEEMTSFVASAAGDTLSSSWLSATAA